jgi:hypothetical protein
LYNYVYEDEKRKGSSSMQSNPDLQASPSDQSPADSLWSKQKGGRSKKGRDERRVSNVYATEQVKWRD